MDFIESQLKDNGFSVFIDRCLTVGMDWAREIEKQIRSADAIIPLLSAESINSEMLSFEIETAHEAAQLQQGRPRLLPVRVNYTGPLPEPLAGILDTPPVFSLGRAAGQPWVGDRAGRGAEALAGGGTGPGR